MSENKNAEGRRLLVDGSTENQPLPGSINLPDGKEGLMEAVRLGFLKPAGPAEWWKWHDARAERERQAGMPPQAKAERREDDRHRIFPATYLIVKDGFVFPRGLTGAHSASFFLPEGIMLPRGDLGHSAVYFLEDGRCLGSTCHSR
jgi:hypothetical protein